LARPVDSATLTVSDGSHQEAVMGTNGPWDDRGHEILGPRVTVYHVYNYLVKGGSKADVLAALPITAEQFDRAVCYIDEHRPEVEEVHRQIEERNARGNPPEVRAKLEETHRRFEAFKARIRSTARQEAGHAGHSGGR
jgi:hypothetical protein